MLELYPVYRVESFMCIASITGNVRIILPAAILLTLHLTSEWAKRTWKQFYVRTWIKHSEVLRMSKKAFGDDTVSNYEFLNGTNTSRKAEMSPKMMRGLGILAPLVLQPAGDKMSRKHLCNESQNFFDYITCGNVLKNDSPICPNWKRTLAISSDTSHNWLWLHFWHPLLDDASILK